MCIKFKSFLLPGMCIPQTFLYTYSNYIYLFVQSSKEKQNQNRNILWLFFSSKNWLVFHAPFSLMVAWYSLVSGKDSFLCKGSGKVLGEKWCVTWFWRKSGSSLSGSKPKRWCFWCMHRKDWVESSSVSGDSIRCIGRVWKYSFLGNHQESRGATLFFKLWCPSKSLWEFFVCFQARQSCFVAQAEGLWFRLTVASHSWALVFLPPQVPK